MTVRRRGARWAVEVYDPSVTSRKRYVGTYGTRREAREAERAAAADVHRRRGRRQDETVASFAGRWLDLYPRRKRTTNLSYAEQVAPFARTHGNRRLHDVGVELAIEWVRDHRWTHGGIRAMFSDARRMGLVDGNPFVNLRFAGSRGRADLAVLSVAEAERLVTSAEQAWRGAMGLTMSALVATAAFIGMRPAELYGLRWSDLDFRENEVRVERQYSARSREFDLPKNGRRRTVVLTPPARAQLERLPRPVDSSSLVFRGSRGGALTGRTQHYYWHPVRVLFGNPSMDFYELRHFCASWLFNDLGLPPQDVAHQLGHTDGGALVQRLYGHPSERLARERIKQATGGRLAAVQPIREANGSQAAT